MRILGLCFFILVFSACGIDQEKHSLSWAHSPADKATGSIIGRLLLNQSDYITDFNPLRICIQNESALSDEQVLLETQLAYAAWLAAASNEANKLWTSMEWQLTRSCSDSDRRYSSTIVIAPTRQIAQEFDRAPLICGREGHFGCMTGGQTLGIARMATNRFSYVRGKAAVENIWPAAMQISPYADWHGLDHALEKLKANHNPSKISELIELYQLLLEDKKNRDFDKLALLVRQMEALQLTEGQDAALVREANKFRQSSIPSINSYYTPEIALFSILLHEAGHQFGMSHAHDPRAGSVTGHNGDGKFVNGKWLTQDSAMTYNDSYFYLTADDKAGIRNLTRQLQGYIQQ